MNSFNQTNLKHELNFDPGEGNPTSNSNAPQFAWNFSANQPQLSAFPTTGALGNDRQAPYRPSPVNTFSRPPPQQTSALPDDQDVQYAAPLADNDPTPLDESYPSTTTNGILVSAMATMVATQFPSISQSRLHDIFSQTIENVTEENQRKALQPYLQHDPPQIQEYQYNSLFGYDYLLRENRGFIDEENDNV